MASIDYDPPLHESYKSLSPTSLDPIKNMTKLFVTAVEEFELPLINLNHLINPNNLLERDKCVKEIVRAASDWGFFQVENHGISEQVLKRLSYEEKKVFHQPFNNKAQNNFLGLPPNSYRWGNPRANCLKQLSWSEAFHISLVDLSTMKECNSLRLIMETFAKEAQNLSKTLAEILAQNLGSLDKCTYFEENCPPISSYLRMNRYPKCPYSSSELVCGLIPHTDSDILSIVYQDQVGGLQLLKDGRWIAVKPNPFALVINIGDLFQALSNGKYKSIKHRVVASKIERFSAAFFYCPRNDATIESLMSCDDQNPQIYKHFTFREYQCQNKKDVHDTGNKIGLQKFFVCPKSDDQKNTNTVCIGK